MKISSVEEYGLRCLLQLARKESEGPVAISELSELEGLSGPHVGKIMRALRSAGLVTSTRGQAGGYCLSRPASEIHVGQVLAALSDRVYSDSFCGDHAGQQADCVHDGDCSISLVWGAIQAAIDRVAARVRLSDLVLGEPFVKRRLLAPVPDSLPLPLAMASGCSSCSSEPVESGSA